MSWPHGSKTEQRNMRVQDRTAEHAWIDGAKVLYAFHFILGDRPGVCHVRHAVLRKQRCHLEWARGKLPGGRWTSRGNGWAGRAD